jgi:hypothetical protein
MSIKKMTEVWEHSQADGTALVLLLKLADFANDAGWCWPGIDRLALACRRSRRQTQRMLAELVELGELEVETNRGSNHTNRYRIAVTPKPSLTFHAEHKDDKNDTGDNSDASSSAPDSSSPPCRQRHGEGDTGDQKGCHGRHPIHQEPSMNLQRARANTFKLEQGEKVEKLNQLLSRHCFATTDKSRREWQSIANEYGRARTFAARCECIEWCIKTARKDGQVVRHAEDVIAYATRWADITERAAS